VKYRRANLDDSLLLAELNHQLIRDEGHRNQMTVPELAERMRGWLATEYSGVIFEDDRGFAAYALYREEEHTIHLRHFFVARDRRRAGLGRRAMRLLCSEIWPGHKRLTVEVLCANTPAIAFYKAAGYAEYSLCLEMLPRN
jgi:ribosomal protein S18 acetylase RimI-like enzyme